MRIDKLLSLGNRRGGSDSERPRQQETKHFRDGLELKPTKSIDYDIQLFIPQHPSPKTLAKGAEGVERSKVGVFFSSRTAASHGSIPVP